MTRAASFTQASVRRLIQAVENEGKSIAAVKIGLDGLPVLLLGEPMRAADQVSGEVDDEWARRIAAR